MPDANNDAPTVSTHPRSTTPEVRTRLRRQSLSGRGRTDLYDFSYDWPAEAAAVPQLVARFTKDMEKAKAELIAGAQGGSRGARSSGGIDYHPHETQRLLRDSRTVRSAAEPRRAASTASRAARMARAGPDPCCGTGSLRANYRIRDLSATRHELDRRDPPAILHPPRPRAGEAARRAGAAGRPVRRLPEVSRCHRSPVRRATRTAASITST